MKDSFCFVLFCVSQFPLQGRVEAVLCGLLGVENKTAKQKNKTKNTQVLTPLERTEGFASVIGNRSPPPPPPSPLLFSFLRFCGTRKKRCQVGYITASSPLDVSLQRYVSGGGGGGGGEVLLNSSFQETEREVLLRKHIAHFKEGVGG